VHYDGDPTRRPVFLDAVARGAMPAGYGADDGVGLLFEDRALVRIVSSRPAARAYRVEPRADASVDEIVIEPELLDSAAPGAPRSVPTDIREFRAQRYGRR
jgi:dipeptidase E